MRGQALLIEAAAVAAVTLIALVAASHLFTPQYATPTADLKLYSMWLLAHLYDRGFLHAMVYGYAQPDPEYARMILDTYIPPNLGYNFTVYTIGGDKVYSISRGFNPQNYAGAHMTLRGPRGSTYIAVLQVSR